jgi:hypothetical protein
LFFLEKKVFFWKKFFLQNNYTLFSFFSKAKITLRQVFEMLVFWAKVGQIKFYTRCPDYNVFYCCNAHSSFFHLPPSLIFVGKAKNLPLELSLMRNKLTIIKYLITAKKIFIAVAPGVNIFEHTIKLKFPILDMFLWA